MPDTFTGIVAEIRSDLDKLIKRVNGLDASVTGANLGLAQRIATLERKVAELEKRN
jgi:hypothetical protein